MKNRVFALFICLVLMLGLLSINAMAAEVVASGECGKNLTWKLDTNGLLTISGTGDMNNYQYYNKTTPWHLYKEKIIDVVIEKGVTRIGNRAFEECYNIESISLPNTLKSIGELAISNCNGLRELHIPEGVTSLESNAIRSCENLKEIYLPASLTMIHENNFFHCDSMTGIWFDENNPVFKSDISGGYIERETGTLLLIPYGFSGVYTISDSVTRFGDAFWGCENMTELVIPASVTEIEANFQDCFELTAFRVHEDNKFYSSDESGSLLSKDGTVLHVMPSGIGAEYSIPEGVTRVERWAINGNDRLKRLKVPASVEIMEKDAIGNSYGLTEIIVDEDNKYYSSDECGVLYNKDKTELICMPSGYEGNEYTIPASVVKICDNAMEYMPNIKELVFEGDAPEFDDFLWNLTVYYPENNPTWTKEVMESFGDENTWIPYNSRSEGDVDGNGQITNADLVMVARYIVGIYDSETVNNIKQYGDMNADGAVNNTDLVTIARIIVGF